MIGWFRKRKGAAKVKNRLGNLSLITPTARPPYVVHDFCPVCARDMSAQAFPMAEITAQGERIVMVCDVCQVLGPLESIITAAAERSGADPQPAQVAHLVGSLLATGASSGLSALPALPKKGS